MVHVGSRPAKKMSQPHAAAGLHPWRYLFIALLILDTTITVMITIIEQEEVMSLMACVAPKDFRM